MQMGLLVNEQILLAPYQEALVLRESVSVEHQHLEALQQMIQHVGTLRVFQLLGIHSQIRNRDR